MCMHTFIYISYIHTRKKQARHSVDHWMTIVWDALDDNYSFVWLGDRRRVVLHFLFSRALWGCWSLKTTCLPSSPLPPHRPPRLKWEPLHRQKTFALHLPTSPPASPTCPPSRLQRHWWPPRRAPSAPRVPSPAESAPCPEAIPMASLPSTSRPPTTTAAPPCRSYLFPSLARPISLTRTEPAFVAQEAASSSGLLSS